MNRVVWVWIVVGIAGAVTTGCGRTPEEICDDFAEECGEKNSATACYQRAEELADKAEEEGCFDELDNYIDCVDAQDSLCDAADTCAGPRDQLERCGVSFE